MLKKVFHVAASVTLLLCTGILAAASPDEFYLQRLRVGVEAYGRGNTVVAADEFRIACFGFLEQPALLVEGLARLSLAQFKTGRMVETDEALSRFAEVELRFDKFREVAPTLDPALKAEFVELAKSRMSQEKFRSIPSLSGLAPKKEEAPKAAEKSKEEPPKKVESKVPEGGAPAAAKRADSGPTVEAIRKLIDDGKVVEAWAKAKEAIGKGAPSRELEKTALIAAVLSKDFSGGLGLAKSVDPFKADEYVEAFYAGVAFWETGNREKATTLFKTAAPRIVQNAWVKYYLSRALGT